MYSVISKLYGSKGHHSAESHAIHRRSIVNFHIQLQFSFKMSIPLATSNSTSVYCLCSSSSQKLPYFLTRSPFRYRLRCLAPFAASGVHCTEICHFCITCPYMHDLLNELGTLFIPLIYVLASSMSLYVLQFRAKMSLVPPVHLRLMSPYARVPS